MRADRLLAMLMLLQTRGRLTARRLSEELEVSERTVYRDIYALRVAGFPVYTERGAGGGCYLVEEFRSGLTSLNRKELSALFLTNIPAPLAQLGVARDLKGALLKLTAALPEARADSGQRMRARIHLDSVPWGITVDSPAHLATLHRATMEDRWVQVTFERILGIRTHRRIAPYGLVAKATTWYIVWCGEDAGLRVDRVSRVLEATAEENSFERPDGFELAEFWASWCERQERIVPHIKVRLRSSTEGLEALRRRCPGRVEEVFDDRSDASSDLEHTAVVRFAAVEEARSGLLALGGAVEVLEPLALRLTMEDFAEKTLDRCRTHRSKSE